MQYTKKRDWNNPIPYYNRDMTISLIDTELGQPIDILVFALPWQTD